MKHKLRKAVFPVAGLGTRFLPATKASSKEMMPVVDKPLIQYAVEEAVDAGIDSLIFISGRSKRAIEDHFDRAPELEHQLNKQGKHEMLKLVKEILPKHISCIYLRQPEPFGLGDAVLHAEPVIGDEPFLVLLADDLICTSNGNNCVTQLEETYNKYGTDVVAVEEVAYENIGKYGILGGEMVENGIWRVKDLVEKPDPEDAPSNLAIIGRYLLKPDIFGLLRNIDPGIGGEIQLTDALVKKVHCGDVIARLHEGKRYDCGSKLGYLTSNVEVGMRDPNIGADFRDYLRKLKVDLD